MRAGERAYGTLRGEILDGALGPGTVLLEVDQSVRLGVSRTPVREALRRLAADGLVEPTARGTIVTAVSHADIVALYELREALEARAAALAARRRAEAPFLAIRERLQHAPRLLAEGEEGLARYFAIVDDLDLAIEEAAANPFLGGALRSVQLHSARIRRLSRHNPARLRGAASEHELIVDAILAGDAELASHATHVHLHRSLTHALASATAPAA
ncbi:GntR family transcriptional regulator [Agromyces marinus]|uniref:GntR family transcriptional regulator n=1 Tax=Agromyces marinus TaxID=1389020 RepID=A0ABN6Y9N5_9MICO|nr:GntR family transcriptional regulator [Agromyces marinus]UIP57926.1 HTH-type transcriptional repressor RspR [Agromyces marinus]BDZ53876.1 GntR family transcriptional regulator [Agromyces marinus]